MHLCSPVISRPCPTMSVKRVFRPGRHRATGTCTRIPAVGHVGLSGACWRCKSCERGDRPDEHRRAVASDASILRSSRSADALGRGGQVRAGKRCARNSRQRTVDVPHRVPRRSWERGRRYLLSQRQLQRERCGPADLRGWGRAGAGTSQCKVAWAAAQ